jgi:bHLH factor
MYNNTLQLNWKVGHGMPLTSVASNLDISTAATGQTIGNVSNVPAITNVMSSINRQGNTNNRKINKKIGSKRSMGGNVISSSKNVRNNSSLVNNMSRGGTIVGGTQGNVSIPEKTTGKKNKNKSYTLRACSIQKRLETEHRTKLPRKRGPKPRPKTAPMSKYRRKTANLRERQRMGEINVAFEILREKIPSPISLKREGKCEKLTKINILHIAINYIRAMENLLETGDSGVNSFKEMVKNPIRDDQDRKMEVQKVLEALMKRADNISSNGNATLKRLPSSRNGGTNRNKSNDGGGGGKRKHTNKNRKTTNDLDANIPDGVLRDRSDNNENFDSAKAMSFLLSKIGSSYNYLNTDIEKEDEKSSGTSDDEDEGNGQSGLSFENMIMLPEWSDLSSTLDISSLGNDKKIDVTNNSTSMPNIFLADVEKVEKVPLLQKEEVSSSFSRFSVYGNTDAVLDGTNSNNINTSLDITNSVISTRTDLKHSSNSLLLELMPIPQNNIKKQQELAVCQSPFQSTPFQSILQVNKNQVVNQAVSTASFSCSPVVSMSPNSSNCSLSSHSSNSSLSSSSSSTINSPISPSISLFKEPDPLFASVALDKTPKYEMKPSQQTIQGAMNQSNQHVKLEARTTTNSYNCNINSSFQQHEQHQHQQVISNSVMKENNNHLLNGSIGVNTGDDIMMRDFTDFVEMVDSLNGMPDIEFVEDNFEIFPT